MGQADRHPRGSLVHHHSSDFLNIIEAVAFDGVATSTFTRMVQVEPALRAYPADFGKIIPLIPKFRLVLRTDDYIRASFQGAPGGQASFKIAGRGEAYPMLEMGV